jgi:hypothetical protein
MLGMIHDGKRSRSIAAKTTASKTKGASAIKEQPVDFPPAVGGRNQVAVAIGWGQFVPVKHSYFAAP